MSKTNAAARAPRSMSRGLGGDPLRMVAVAAMALVGGIVATLLFAGASGSFLSGIIGGFAAFGAFWAASMVWRSFRGEPAPVEASGPVVLEASPDAMAVVEDGERVVESNPAYLSLCRSEGREPPSPERFLSRVPGTQAAMSELLGAVADGKAFTRRISFDSGSGGRQLEISVQPLKSRRRVLWSLRVIEAPPAPAPVASVLPTVEAVAELAPLAALDDKTASALLEAWERAPAGVARFGRDRVVLANASLCRLLGYGLAEWPAEGMALQEVIAPAYVPDLRGALGPGRGAASLELDLTRKDGRPLAVFLRLGVSDAAGEATAVILPRTVLPTVGVAAPSAGAAAPAAAARVAPAPVVRSAEVGEASPQPAAAAPGQAPARADVDRFFLRAPVALALLDAQGRIRAANAAFARLFGAEAATAGQPLRAVISERDAAAVDGFLGAARSGTQPSGPCDVTATGAGGRSARLYAAPLGGADASGGDIALCAIDTSEQKALEAQFAQSQRLQAVGHLAGGVAHDFNNVLTAIIGYCDLLLAKHRPSDPSFPDIMQIKQNANRAAALVRQLLAFSRRQTLRPQAVELTDVISDVSELLRRLIGERITLDVQHARDLWPVKVDVNQFEQVIVNLVVNARDAMPDGGTLTLRTANVPESACAAYGAGNLTPADYVVVEVEDTGTGIPPEIIDKIFEPFFSTKEVGKGTGLGLSTVYGIVQQTGGTILAASEMGKGTVFRVFLPRYVPSAEPEPQRPAEPEVKMGDSTGQGRILLVEDEDAVRAFASRALSARGYEVLTAASGVEALELLEKGEQSGARPVDLVISDVVMPEMDGPSLLKELRARDPGMKVIFISGYAEEAFARNLPPSEHFAFLPKPFSLKQLVAAVNTALRGGE
ncbi:MULTISPECIES: ATP-binding protein [unclassified Xanthobacter]|uniref:ATP-binding protein n=5 Tax=Xanthobacter TaxID=279 RepID=UPI001F2B4693|nr:MULTISPECIES: ATP-binding protein [unclassified Xanthobacter]